MINPLGRRERAPAQRSNTNLTTTEGTPIPLTHKGLSQPTSEVNPFSVRLIDLERELGPAYTPTTENLA